MRAWAPALVLALACTIAFESSAQPPTPLAGHAVARIATGCTHTCMLRADGAVYCWGNNGEGQLGDGTTTVRRVPTRVHGLTDVAELALGCGYGCARTHSGAVLCWGSNHLGQLGDGTTTDRREPVYALHVTNAVEIDAGDSHACARTSDARVMCWGYDYTGQIGDLTTPDGLVSPEATSVRSTPFAVAGLSSVAELALGGSHSCARRSDGSVMCWGDNGGGQIGDGTTTYTRHAPTLVAGLTDATHISAGGSHTCARRADATVVCWGSNQSAQLGDGSTTGRTTPAPVPGLGNVADITLGGSCSCARLTDGSALRWGANSDGQLGDGTTTDRDLPTPVQGLADIAALAVGGQHTCAQTVRGALLCWGANNDGRLGFRSREHCSDDPDDGPAFCVPTPTRVRIR